MPVLRALSKRSTPATAAQVHRAARYGTLAGIQRACERLVEHGLVLRDEAGGRVVYAINDRHLLYPAVLPLLQAQDALPRLLEKAIAGWTVQPVTAALFGSAARGDGTVDSDIDLLLIRPTVRGGQEAAWAGQIRTLAQDVRAATGNRLQVVDLLRAAARVLVRAKDPIVAVWHAEAITVGGDDVDDVLDRLR